MKYINIYNTQSFDDNKVALDNLPYYTVLNTDNDTIYLKKKFIFHYKISDYLIQNVQPQYNNKLPLISRCDLFKRIIIDGEEIDLSSKIREPHQFTTSGNDLIFELGSLILNDNGFNENYVLTKTFDKPISGIIEVELNNNVQTLIGAFMFDVCLSSIDARIFQEVPFNSTMSLFSSCSHLTTLNLQMLNTNNVTNMFSMFANCNDLNSILMTNFNTSQVKDMNSMFMSCNNLITLDLTHFDTTNVTTMYSMFLNCKKLVSLDLSSFSTINVNDMASMFDGCTNLYQLKLNQFSIKNVKDMARMFHNCDSLNEITCTQEFQNWCFLNQNIIELPLSMRERGSGKWIIIN